MYYKAKEKKPDTDIKVKIEQVLVASPYYGYKRVTKQLQRDGQIVNEKRIYRIMGEWHLLQVRKRKNGPKTTNSNHKFFIYPNVVKDLSVRAPSTVWVSDVTYVWIGNRWAYLALIMDQGSRRVVGFSFGLTLRKELCLDALELAVRSAPLPIYHH